MHKKMTLLQPPDPQHMLTAGFIRRGTLFYKKLDDFINNNPGAQLFICPFVTIFGVTKIEIWSRPFNSVSQLPQEHDHGNRRQTH